MAEMGGTHSQTPIPPLSSSLYLHPLKQNLKRKLEDYLDPLLLHTISSRIGPTKTKEKQQMEKKVIFVNTIQRSDFDWPVDRLEPLLTDQNRVTARDSGNEDDGARFFSPSKRRSSDFPMSKVNDSRHGAA